MRTWSRAKGRTSCGKCAARIEPGSPLLVIEIGLVKLLRCPHCAEEAAPDLPQAEVSGPSSFTPLRTLASKAVPFDPKMAQAGRDE